jgi:hypothetical protein
MSNSKSALAAPRRPTVTSPRDRRFGAPRRARPRIANRTLARVAEESVAALAMTGAAITVLAVLSKTMPTSPYVARLLERWQDLMHSLWRPPFELAGIELHPNLVAALNVALFMTLIGVGARFSRWLAGRPLAPLSWRFFEDQSWPSLLVFAALCMIFLLGAGNTLDNPLTLFGSEDLGKYAFSLLGTAGYFAGDFIGHREFHLRLYRLAALVAALVAVNLALVLA